MKSVLLLAAVYSLIIHQWHKEKGSVLATTPSLKSATGTLIGYAPKETKQMHSQTGYMFSSMLNFAK